MFVPVGYKMESQMRLQPHQQHWKHNTTRSQPNQTLILTHFEPKLQSAANLNRMQTQLVAALSLLWLSSVAQCFIISVKDTTGREHKLDVDPTKTVGSLKQKIHEFESSIMPTTMELIFGGHRLEDDRMLAGCGLVHGSTILVMRKKEEKLEFYGVDARDIDKIEQKIDELAWKDLGSLDGVAMKKVKEAEKIRDSLWLGYEKFMEEKTGKRRP